MTSFRKLFWDFKLWSNICFQESNKYISQDYDWSRGFCRLVTQAGVLVLIFYSPLVYLPSSRRLGWLALNRNINKYSSPLSYQKSPQRALGRKEKWVLSMYMQQTCENTLSTKCNLSIIFKMGPHSTFDRPILWLSRELLLIRLSKLSCLLLISRSISPTVKNLVIRFSFSFRPKGICWAWKRWMAFFSLSTSRSDAYYVFP